MIKAACIALVGALSTWATADSDNSVPRLSRLGGAEIRFGDLGFAYCGPTIVTDHNDSRSPSFALATIKTSNEKSRLLFLMVLDYGGKQITGAGWNSEPRIEGHNMNDASTMIIDGTKKMSFAFGYNANNKSPETFSIDGRVLDGNSPRVFIADLTGKTPTLTPFMVQLPSSVPDFHSLDARQNGKEWQKMIAELKRSSLELKQFIDGYGR